MKKAIVLCSGGLDSITTTYYVKKIFHADVILVLFFDYGQKTLKKEEHYAKKCAHKIGAEFLKLSLTEMKSLSASYINHGWSIQKIHLKSLRNTRHEMKKWYVPCRNLIFLSYATALAEHLSMKTKKKYDIFVGFKNEGTEHYPDATASFITAFNALSAYATLKKLKVYAPLITKDKEDIILLAQRLGVPLEQTWSCYIGKKKHCGSCLACRLRQAGFYWANVSDPTRYAFS